MNSSSSTANLSKSKNESSMSILPSHSRLSRNISNQEYEDNLFIYRMNVSRIARKEKELNLKKGMAFN